MALTVNVRTRAGSTVVSLAGLAGEALLERVADGIVVLVEDGRPLVVDVNDVVLSAPAGIRGFLEVLHRDCPDVRIVCGRLSGRRLLRRCSPHPGPQTFATVDDALADRWAAVRPPAGLRGVG